MFAVILTLFPEAVRAYLDESILGIAKAQDKLRVELVDFRDYTRDKHRSVDDRPFGGGPGMVLKPEPIFEAVEDTERRFGSFHRVLLCPRGRRFTQARARSLAAEHDKLLLLCGRYEGFDERIRLGMEWDEISVGDFVLAGGELPALCVLEATVRLIPGVLGCDESAAIESFENRAEDGSPLLDHPQYTRPRSFRGMDVPDVLLSGDHGAIERWRAEESHRLSVRPSDTSPDFPND
jgi:tRNA (guanine37-N1)-methyltransferase